MGCLRAPHTVPIGSDFVQKVERRVLCELKDSYQVLRNDYEWLDRWRAAFELTLVVDDTVRAGPTGSFDNPFKKGIFGASANANATSNASRTSQLKFKINLRDVPNIKCLPTDSGHDAPKGVGINGDLGIYHWIESSVGMLADKKSATYLQTVGQSVTFVTIYDANISPNVTFIRVSGNEFNGSFGFGGTKKKTHSLGIAITEIPAEELKGITRRATDEADRKLDNQLYDLRIESLKSIVQ